MDPGGLSNYLNWLKSDVLGNRKFSKELRTKCVCAHTCAASWTERMCSTATRASRAMRVRARARAIFPRAQILRQGRRQAPRRGGGGGAAASRRMAAASDRTKGDQSEEARARQAPRDDRHAADGVEGALRPVLPQPPAGRPVQAAAAGAEGRQGRAGREGDKARRDWRPELLRTPLTRDVLSSMKSMKQVEGHAVVERPSLALTLTPS
eukprot:6987851-Prymnesium_polylepis.1